MAPTCGGASVSRWDPQDAGDLEALEDWYEDARTDEAASDAAWEWAQGEIAEVFENLGAIAIAGGCGTFADDMARMGETVKPCAEVDSPAVAVILAEVGRLQRLAEEHLADPWEVHEICRLGRETGETVHGLEIAQCLADRAWHLLAWAQRRTLSLRSLMGLSLAAQRISAIRETAYRGQRPPAARIKGSRRPRPADAVLSLTRAAHAPPAAGVLSTGRGEYVAHGGSIGGGGL